MVLLSPARSCHISTDTKITGLQRDEVTTGLSEVAPRLGQRRPPAPDSFTTRSPRSASRLKSKRRRSPGLAGVVCASLPRSRPGTHPPDDEAGTRFSEQPGGQPQETCPPEPLPG
ncbi:unnamed protein product [Rangifer tarandus platyrhynchus]|uniref:Uncharacterized protein n=2 Tax=Rangifer tarandus platyrhynchus TaxID=3082113 RepID=A0ACB0EHW4_RANTA|nr:unnamed protein product [Rangifer tarandus platyrhynchus]CAI9700230.1 unnamed protein product [Rangifer tarandus platyrhynchus]